MWCGVVWRQVRMGCLELRGADWRSDRIRDVSPNRKSRKPVCESPSSFVFHPPSFLHANDSAQLLTPYYIHLPYELLLTTTYLVLHTHHSLLLTSSPLHMTFNLLPKCLLLATCRLHPMRPGSCHVQVEGSHRKRVGHITITVEPMLGATLHACHGMLLM